MAEGSVRRYLYLDSLRGIAVLLMIIAHAIYFFSDRSSTFLVGLEAFANTVAFTTFLIIAGAVTYIAYLSCDQDKRRHNFISRLMILLMSYYLLASISSLSTITALDGWGKAKFLLSIISLRELPSYTEFFVPFIIYGIAVYFFPRFFRKLTANWLILTVGILGSFYLGEALSVLKLSYIFEPYQRLIAGGEGIYRFSLLHYFGVYLIGLYFGKSIVALRSNGEENDLIKIYSSFFVVLLTLSFVINYSFTFADSFLVRWPPNIAFLLVGCAFAFILMRVIATNKIFTKFGIIRELSLIFGQNAFALLWTHLVFLQIYTIAGGERVDSPLILLGLIGVLVVASLALATFIPLNFKFSLTKIRPTSEVNQSSELIFQVQDDIKKEIRQDIELLQEKLFLGKGIFSRRKFVYGAITAVTLVWLGLLLYPVLYQQVQTVVSPASQQEGLAWWDESWSYRQQLTLINPKSFDTFEKGKIVKINLDHLQMVKDRQSNHRGSDLRVVFQAPHQAIELTSRLENPQQNNSTIYFPLEEKLDGGKRDNRYFLYFSNSIAQAQVTQELKFEDSQIIKNDQELGGIEIYPIFASVSRVWHILDNKKKSEQIAHIEINTNEDLSDYNRYFKVINRPLSGPLRLNEQNIYQGSFSYSSLEPGYYQVQAFFEKGQVRKTSQKVGFIVSKPLYFSWTVDWEGYDVSDQNIKALFDISEKYQIPLTHYYSPRIYLAADITAERADELERIVKARLEKGDELGLHLHMQRELVEGAQVSYRPNPRWGYGKGDGYDVPTFSYSQEELSKIIAFSLKLLEQRGLKKPVCYRAGGWFADEKLLNALQENNIHCDSSGRPFYNMGNPSVKTLWNLKEGAQPYRPSINGMNQTTPPVMNLVEIPNNLLDSYNSKATDLIALFNRIYQEGPINNLRQLTFTSHPQWFDNRHEKKTAQAVIEEAARYRYLEDRGPLVFSTVADILEIYHQSEK